MKKLILLTILLCFSNISWANDNFDKGLAAYNQKDYAIAFTFWEPLAKSGNKVAQYNLGVMYKNGQGVPQDYQQAVAWYRKAAEQGYANAQYNLGVMYDNGQGVAQDYQQAVAWYRKAAEQGDASAQYNLGIMYDNGQGVAQDYKQAAAWYRKAAKQGHARAQTNLGVMYKNGQGVLQDYQQAVAWYRKAAEQGHVNAQYNLGVMYDNGQGVVQDYQQAVAWYRKAAEQGHASAQNNLGWMYQNGQGVTQDYQQAVAWYRKAAKQGNLHAQNNLKDVLAIMEMASCQEGASTKLFGVFIKCANRDVMMAAIKKAGAGVKSEDKNKWGDYYYTSKVLKGSSQLYMGYTVNDWFAYAQYTFPSRMDNQQVLKIKNMVASKYGEPDTASGNIGLGKVVYQWQLKDGIKLKVSRGWPDTTTYMRYTYPKNYKAMQDEIERQRIAREKKEAQAQSNAF